MGQFSGTHISQLHSGFSTLLCRIMHIEGMKCVNIIMIGPVIVEIERVENGELVVPVMAHLCATPLSWPLTHDRVS